MASTTLAHPTPRVSRTTKALLLLAGEVDGYWARHELSKTYREAWPTLPSDEREAFGLIEKALFRLFPFDVERDMPDAMRPRHAI